MPGNARDFFVQIMTIAAFDYYDFSNRIHALFQVPRTKPINDDFEALGFESEYLIVNMGSLIVPWLLHAVLIIVLILISCCQCRSERARRLHQKIYRFLFWGFNITLVNESFMIVIVCLLINVKHLSFATPGLTAMSITCLIFFGLYTIVPAIFILRTCTNHSALTDGKLKLEDPKWMSMYGAYYEDLHIRAGRYVFFHPSFFLLRRLLIAVAVSLVGDVFIYQFLIFTAQIIVQVIIIGSGVFPAGTTRSRYFNESIMMLSIYTFMPYTPWVSDAQTRFLVGYESIFFIVLHILVNLGPISIETLKMTFKKIRTKFAIRKFKG